MTDGSGLNFRVRMLLKTAIKRLRECVRSKKDSQSVAKEHDRRHTMLFNNLITQRFGGQIA